MYWQVIGEGFGIWVHAPSLDGNKQSVCYMLNPMHGLSTSSTGVSWEFVQNAELQAQVRPTESESRGSVYVKVCAALL